MRASQKMRKVIILLFVQIILLRTVPTHGKETFGHIDIEDFTFINRNFVGQLKRYGIPQQGAQDIQPRVKENELNAHLELAAAWIRLFRQRHNKGNSELASSIMGIPGTIMASGGGAMTPWIEGRMSSTSGRNK